MPRRCYAAGTLVLGTLVVLALLLTRTTSATAEAPLPSPDAAGLGVNVDLVAADPASRARQLRWLASNDVPYVRQPVRWSEIEPTRGRYDWSAYDAVVAALAEREIALLAVVHTAPAWARRDPPLPAGWMACDDDAAVDPALSHRRPPTDPADLARFTAALAARYRGRLWAVEVWREPNILPNWRVTGPDPEDYARLLEVTAARLAAVAPEVIVVSAGLAPTTDVGVCYLSDVVFLDRLAATGALRAVDAVGIEPFGLRAPPGGIPPPPLADGVLADVRQRDWLARAREQLGVGRAQVLHAVLRANDVERPLWALAFGWHATPGIEAPDPAGSPWGTVPPATAARWTQQAWATARSEWPWLGPMLLWHLDPAAPADDPVNGFALLGPDGTPTAVGRAAGAMLRGEVAPDAAAGVLWEAAPDSGGRAVGERPPDADGSSNTDARPAAGVRGDVASGSSEDEGPRAGGLVAAARSWATTLARGGYGGTLGMLAALAAVISALALAIVLLAPRWAARPAERLRRRLAFGQRSATSASVVAAAFALLFALDLAAPPVLSLVLVAGLVVLAATRPRVALAATAAALPFSYALHPHLGPRAVGAVELLLAVLLAGVLLRRGLTALAATAPAGSVARPSGLVGARARLSILVGRIDGRSWLDGLAVLIVAWAALSVLWADVPRPALREWRTVLLEPLLLYVVLRTAVERRAAVRAALDGLVLGGVLAALWALAGVGLELLVMTGRLAADALPLGAVAAEGVLRARGPYGSPNNLALYLGRLTPVLAAYAVWGRGRRRTAYRWAAPLVLLALAATFSRGALLVGLPAVGLYLVVVAGGTWLRRAVLAAAGALAALLLPFAGTARLAGALDPSPGGTLFIRQQLWAAALRMARDHPWRGVGLDQFLYHYRDRYVPRAAAQERFLNHPHNWLLDWWTRLGLVGLLAFALLAAGNLWRGWQSVRGAPEDGPRRALVVAVLGMQLYALAHGLVDNVFFLVDLAAVWWIAQAGVLAGGDATERGAGSV